MIRGVYVFVASCVLHYAFTYSDPPKYPDWPITPVVKPTTPDPMPSPVSVLGGELYVVQGDGNQQLLASPTGLVAITEEAGPIKIRGVFVDGKTVETRTYTGKQVWIVERVLGPDGKLSRGTFELIKVPKGTLERRVVGDAQPPPPKPVDPIDPPKPVDPPQPSGPVIGIDGVSVLLIYENDDRPKYSKEWNGILLSSTLYAYLDSVCAKHPDGKTQAWRMWDKDDAAKYGSQDSKAFDDAQKRPRTTVPWAIISSRNGSYEGPWPADEDALIALIKKTIAPKSSKK